MKYSKFIFSLCLLMILSCNSISEPNPKLQQALQDSSLKIRGSIVEIGGGEYRLDYYDVSEPDSHLKYLISKGYQGGGYTWEGIIYGAVQLSEPVLLQSIEFDPEADGLAIFSRDKHSLEKVGRLIAILKSDDAILDNCIKVATQHLKIE